MKRQLILEDGTCLMGEALGGDHYQVGELIFHTAMEGYQEILSDVAYDSQIVTFTYPLIGNCGINRDDFESNNPALFGIVVKEACKDPSNYQHMMTLDAYLKEQNIPGITGVDTRMLAKKIRNQGVMKATFANEDADVKEIVATLKRAHLSSTQVKNVSIKNTFLIPNSGKRVVLVDFGVRRSILKELSLQNFEIYVVPYHTTSKEILELQPDGVFLSSGPGNPEDIKEVTMMIKDLLGIVPIFATGLGYQLLAMAEGASVNRLLFGHHGSNHPVMCQATQTGVMTNQNCLYAIHEESLHKTNFEITHKSLNDKSVEGIAHKNKLAYGVAFFPEQTKSGQGDYILDKFIQMVNQKEVKQDA